MILYMNKQILFLFGIFLSIIILATFFKRSSVYEGFQEGISEGKTCNPGWSSKCDTGLKCKSTGGNNYKCKKP